MADLLPTPAIRRRARRLTALAACTTCCLGSSFATASPLPTRDAVLMLAVAPAEPVRGGLEVDASALGEDGPALQARIEERCKGVLLDAEVLPARNDDDPAILVAVQPSGTAEEPGFAVQTWVMHRAAEVPGSRQTAQCPLCTEGELVTKIEQSMAAAVDIVRGLSEERTEEPAGPESTEPTETSETNPNGSRDDEPAPRRLSTLGGVGIGVGALGLVGVGVGAGLVAVDGTFVAGDANTSPQVKATKGGGFALIGAGSAALIAGVVMLAVDLKRDRSDDRAAVAPILGPGTAGLSFSRRF